MNSVGGGGMHVLFVARLHCVRVMGSMTDNTLEVSVYSRLASSIM